MKKARNHSGPHLTRVAALLASAFGPMLALHAQAQTQPSAAAPAAAASAPTGDGKEGSGLERVVITATSTLKSKMRSSVSVTDIDQDQIKDFGARSEAEVLLLVPGIRVDTPPGPGGNSNITVRGLPISSGGSKYVQIQEDGLPTVQFGDMNFSNNDYWTRFDNSVDTIQTLRGGSSSVFASHAPGAVINYVSKTGREQGGSVGISSGLNYKEMRFDGNYGGRLAPDLRFHVGGYYRQGEGVRNYTDNALLGYQIKGNLTKEFNGTKGWFRVNFKVLDEHAPSTPQTFLNATLNGNKIGGFARTPGYDGTKDSQYSIYNGTVPGIDPITRQLNNTTLLDGITVNSKSIGFEFHNELANGFSIDNKFRKSTNSGAFQMQFWNVRTLGNLLTSTGDPWSINYTNAARAVYYNGPLAGQTVTAANLQTGLVSDGAAINTQTPDMGNIVNDFSVGKQFKLDAATLDLKGGLFFSRQNVVQRWMISNRVVEVGSNGAIIDLVDGAGAALTTAGLTGYNNQWGCCSRDIDAKFSTTAPYLSLGVAAGNLDVDAGVRRESFSARGSYAAGSARPFDVNGDGAITGAERNVWLIDPAAARGLVNYTIHYTNFSLGANYRVTPDLSAFVRHSKGNRAISDRLLFSPNIDAATGALAAGGATAALAPVKQSEIGAKNRGSFGGVSYNVAATLFHSTTDEFDFDQTRQDNPALPNFRGPKLNQLGYKANGLELETSASTGGFGLLVNVTYSKEKVTTDVGGTAIDNLPANVANPAYVKVSQAGRATPGVPKLRYSISPRYTIGGLTVGAVVRGNGELTNGDNVNKINGHFITNAFANYDFGNGLIASLNIYNLFDKVYPYRDGGFVGGSTTVFGTGAEAARTFNASLRYAF